MKTTIRLTLLLNFAVIAFFGILSVPVENEPAWLVPLMTSKIIGILAAFAFARCYRSWSRTDKLLRRYEQWLNNED